jgi:ubiquinone/menaquinone biosynthesis C-methylase UbiE
MKKSPFEVLASEYEEWFDENQMLFQSELLALKQAVPVGKKGIEIGIGSGIFAQKLSIKHGIDPSKMMLSLARRRGLDVVKGVAENLPYPDASFDFAVFITSLCFVDSPVKAIEEAHRILKHHGEIIIAIIDKESVFGKFLDKEKMKSRFYKYASFFSVPQIISLLEGNGFKVKGIFQTLEDPGNTEIENPQKGYGKGSFVVIRGVKINSN